MKLANEKKEKKIPGGSHKEAICFCHILYIHTGKSNRKLKRY